MLTEKELTWLSVLLSEVDFDRSPSAQEGLYQDLVAKYDRLCARLCGKLDDRRAELLRELLDCRDQMEYEHNLHYLKQGLIQGAAMADRIEISGKHFTFS